MKFVAPSNNLEKVVFIVLKYWRYILLSIVAVLVTNIVSKALITDPNKMEKVSYVVAKNVVTQGEQIKETDLTTMEFIKGYEPANAYRLEDMKVIIGTSPLVNLQAGALITKGIVGKFEEAPVIRIAQTAPGKKVIYFRSSDFHTIPPIIKTQNYIDITAYPTKDEKLPPTIVITRALVVDLEYKNQNENSGVEEIGLALDDKEISNILAKLNSEWILNIVIHPL